SDPELSGCLRIQESPGGPAGTRSMMARSATRIASRSVPCQSRATWVEQDSNLRRQCHQIYSLAPLAAWVSTRVVIHILLLSVCSLMSAGVAGGRLLSRMLAELAVRLELTTLGLQNRSSTG